MDNRRPQKIQTDPRVSLRGYLHHWSIHEQKENPKEPTSSSWCLNFVFGFQIWRNLSTRAQRFSCGIWKQIHKTDCVVNGKGHSACSQLQTNKPICLQILTEIQENECGFEWRWGLLLCAIFARNTAFRRFSSQIQAILNCSCIHYFSEQTIEKNKLLEQRNGKVLGILRRVTLWGCQRS